MTITVERSVAAALRLMAKNKGGTTGEELNILAEQLDPVGLHSTSYPFLALARMIDAKYGDVLWFADFLTAEDPFFLSKHPSQHYRDALERLTQEQRQAIFCRINELERVKREAAT